MNKIKINEIQLKNVDIDFDHLFFLICQFHFDIKRIPYIIQNESELIWNKIKQTIHMSKTIGTSFTLAPEFSLPFSKFNEFIKIIKNKDLKNQVFCIPFEHLLYEQLHKICKKLDLNISQQLSDEFVKNNKYQKFVFNVVLITIKDNQGKAHFYLQLKLFPAQLEENANLNPYNFFYGQYMYIFHLGHSSQLGKLSFAIIICFDFISRQGIVPNKVLNQWIEENQHPLDFLFILQVNPKPLHRDFEKNIYFLLNKPVFQNTSLFFVNCASTTILKDNNNKNIEGFNKSSIINRFKTDYTTEYRVEDTIEIPPDSFSKREQFFLGNNQRLTLIEKGERIALVKAYPLRNYRKGPSFNKENDIRLFNFSKKGIQPLPYMKVIEINKLKSESPSLPKSKSRIVNFCVPIKFIGRKNEISKIGKFLKSKNKILIIHGEAGIGKSALAQYGVLHFFNQPDSCASAGFWFSSKYRHLNIETFIQDFTLISNYVYIMQLEENKQKKEILRILKDEFRSSAILIFDNFETIYDNQMIKFIQNLSKHSKIIITSRKKFSSSKYSTVKLDPLSKQASTELIENFWPNIDRPISQKLIQISRGNPHLLNLLFGYMRSEHKKNINSFIDDLETTSPEITDWILYRFVKQFGINGRIFIKSIQLFADFFTEPSLFEITGLSFYQNNKFLTETTQRNIIEKINSPHSDQQRYQIHPLVRKSIQKIALDNNSRSMFIKYYLSYVNRNVEKDRLDLVNDEIANIENALRYTYEEEIYPTQALELISVLYNFYWEKGLWNEAIKKCFLGFQIAQKSGDSYYAMEMAARISWCAFRKENYELARNWLKKAKKYFKSTNLQKILFYRYIEEIKVRLDWSERKISFKRAKSIIENIIAQYHSMHPMVITMKSRSFTYIGELYSDREDYQNAITYFLKAKQIADQYGKRLFSQKIKAWSYGNIGEAMYRILQNSHQSNRNERLKECLQMFNMGMKYAKIIDRMHTIAQCSWGIGIIQTELGNIEFGKKYLNFAKANYKKLGKESKIIEINNFLQKSLK